LASFGFALPFVAFITWPTRNPNVCCLPARYWPTASAFFAITSRIAPTMADSSPICASPSPWTISSALRPDSIIVAKTSLPIAVLMVPLSISLISPASAPGETGRSATSMPRSFITRSSSPMIQLLAAFGFDAAAAVCSK